MKRSLYLLILVSNTAFAAQSFMLTDESGNKATIRNLATADAANVAIVDGSGNQITSFGGGTQYANGVSQATPTGTAIMGRDESDIIRVLSIDSAGRPRTLVTQESGAVMRVINVGGASSTTTITQDIGAVANVSSAQSGAWTVTANAGTNLNTSLLATESTLSSLNGKVVSIDTGKVTISTIDVPFRMTQDAGAVANVALGTSTNTIGSVNQAGAPWQVQSNSANIATESTLNTVNGKITSIDTGRVSITTSIPLRITQDIGAVANVSIPTNTRVVISAESGSIVPVDVRTALPTGTNSIGNIGTLSTLTSITNTVRITQDSGAVANVTIPSGSRITVTQDVGSVMNVTVPSGSRITITQDAGALLKNVVTQEAAAVMRVINVGSSGSGFSDVDNSAFTEDVSEFVPVGGVYNDSIGPAVSGNAATARLTQRRAIHINPRSQSGKELVSVSQDAVKVELVRNKISIDTYSAVTRGGALVLATNATDFFTLRNTSAAKIIRVKRITIGGFQTTARHDQFFIIKRLGANSGGTSINLSITSFDSSNAAPVGEALSYTVNPTLGTPAYTLDVVRVLTPNLTTAAPNTSFILEYRGNDYSSPILRNNETLALNFGGKTKGANLSVDVCMIWTEESIP